MPPLWNCWNEVSQRIKPESPSMFRRMVDFHHANIRAAGERRQQEEDAANLIARGIPPPPPPSRTSGEFESSESEEEITAL